jgi:hypothetical protein
MELLIYVLLSFASLSGPVVGLALLGRGPHDPAAWYVFAISVAIIVVGGLREARRDLDKLATFAMVMGFLWTLVYGTGTFVVDDRRAAYGAVAVLLGALTGACLVRVVRSALWKDAMPSLRSLGWSPNALLEMSGVQFALACEVAADSPHSRFIRVDLQNCTLGPLHVGTLRIEVPGQLPGGRYSVTPTVSGDGGKRERRWRAKAYSPPVSAGFQVLAALTGYLVWGGGVSMSIPPSVAAAPASATPIVTWKCLWPAEGR